MHCLIKHKFFEHENGKLPNNPAPKRRRTSHLTHNQDTARLLVPSERLPRTADMVAGRRFRYCRTALLKSPPVIAGGKTRVKFALKYRHLGETDGEMQNQRIFHILQYIEIISIDVN